MATIRRILGKRGRITIPYDLRKILGFKLNDVLTFALTEDEKCVVITKEKLCTDCMRFVPYGEEVSIEDILAHMTKDELIKARYAITKALMDKGGRI